jgi:hypothetical protein
MQWLSQNVNLILVSVGLVVLVWANRDQLASLVSSAGGWWRQSPSPLPPPAPRLLTADELDDLLSACMRLRDVFIRLGDEDGIEQTQAIAQRVVAVAMQEADE